MADTDIAWKAIPTSRNVAEIGYRADPPAMYVRWVKGRVTEYDGVDQKLFEEILKSPSVGSAIHDRIKGKFPFVYVAA